MKCKCFFLLLVFLIFSSNVELKSETAYDDNLKEESIFDVMQQVGALKINLIFNVQKVIDNRKSDEEYPALLTFLDKNGIVHKWDIEVKARGVFRRYNCSLMPPIKLNFKKKDLKKAGLSKFDDYKLVTHCIEDEVTAKAIVLKEYLAYKYYNSLTNNSFRVQLLNINFIDSATGIIRQQTGFIIEDFGLLRNRLGAQKVEQPLGISKEDINQKEFKTMALFQYMIGNADWSMSTARNVKIMLLDGKYVVIPYDFDFAGLVLAPYARISTDYGLSSLRERVYLGYEDDLLDMKSVKKRFKRRKWRFRRMTRHLSILEKNHKKSVLVYLKSFYKQIDNIQVPEKSGVIETSFQ